jgi:hypothetical protein
MKTLKEMVVVTLLRANRIGQANRALIECKSLASSIISLSSNGSIPSFELLASKCTEILPLRNLILAGLALEQKSEALAATLIARRFYLDKTVAQLKDTNALPEHLSQLPDETIVFDPRFLVFEFTWNILIRESQVCCMALC